jgi:hypothetical protein
MEDELTGELMVSSQLEGSLAASFSPSNKKGATPVWQVR